MSLLPVAYHLFALSGTNLQNNINLHCNLTDNMVRTQLLQMEYGQEIGRRACRCVV